MSQQGSAGTPGAAAADPRSTSSAAGATTTTTSSTASDATSFDAAAAAAAAAAANKTRRSHRKSRNGCAECKRRHIRCDERRPVCSNCVSADRTCVFPRGPAASASSSSTTTTAGVSKAGISKPNGHHGGRSPSHLPSPGGKTITTTTTTTTITNSSNGGGANGNTPPSPRHDFGFDEVCGPLPRPGTSSNFRRSNYTYYPSAANAMETAPPTPHSAHHHHQQHHHHGDADASASASVFSPFHLQLFHHIQTVMLPDPNINTSNHFQQFVDIAMRHAVDAPYLINEILAMAALHMATQKENQLYQQQLQQQQQQQQQNHQNHDGSASNTPISTSHPAVLPPLLPPHGSPSSTSSPASSSILPSLSTSTPPSTTPSSTTTTATNNHNLSLTTTTSVMANPIVTNLRHQATELQTRAVANFTRLTAHLPPDDTASCIPRFLFSSTLSMHALADSLAELRAANADFHGFIDRFVDCFNLYRGIRAVIYPTWQFLSDSELRPLLQVTREANLGIVERGHECAPLHDLLCRSDLAPTSLEACRVAVEKLQWAFDLHNNLPPYTGQHAVSAFSVIVSAEYVDVLRKHRPEALIILSYFAVLLHRCRHFWIFQNSGAYMIKAIAHHIGSYWRDAMAWPLQVIETEDC